MIKIAHFEPAVFQENSIRLYGGYQGIFSIPSCNNSVPMPESIRAEKLRMMPLQPHEPLLGRAGTQQQDKG
jgi:hypothetical protein